MATVRITSPTGGMILGPSFVVYGDYDLAKYLDHTVLIKCRLEDHTPGHAVRIIKEVPAAIDGLYWDASFNLTTGASDPYGTNRVLVASISVDSGGYEDGPTVGFFETLPQSQVRLDIDAPEFGFRVTGPSAVARKKYKAKGKCTIPDASISSFESKVTQRGVEIDKKLKDQSTFDTAKWKLKGGSEHELNEGQYYVHEVTLVTTPTGQRHFASIKLKVS